ncbi:MAG: DUF2284 domain-containing protein [Candidatus Izemoplasmatales bacterium]|nr:DUF2284 domain-containing protein [Candidatus Izemoplasmatales bacterium]MDY0138153.1 DUF2284 domain-containing protein [Candidatus Izemoplasmatales bacterium]
MRERTEKFLKQKEYIYQIINPQTIVFRDEYAQKCAMNYCGKYNKSWSCPSAIGNVNNLREKVLQFKYAFLYSKITNLEDAYDVESMDKGRNVIMNDTLELLDLLKKGSEPFYILSAGSCSICKTCTYPNQPCRFPERMLISLEALGIDVALLAKENGLKYYNGVNTVTYFSIIFFGKKNE